MEYFRNIPSIVRCYVGSYLWNRQHSQISKIVISKRWPQNYKVFNFESFVLIMPHCSKRTPAAKDLVNELNREQAWENCPTIS